MASYLRRCVAMRDRRPGDFQRGVVDKYLYWRPDSQTSQSGGYRNIGFYQETQTKKVRLWVSWKYLQPYSQTANPAADTNSYSNGGQYSYLYSGALGSPADYVASLDAEIALARQFGFHVILTTYHDFLHSELSHFERRPKPNDFPDIERYFSAWKRIEAILKGEAFLRRCRAFRLSGRRLDAPDESDRPLIDENDRLLSVE